LPYERLFGDNYNSLLEFVLLLPHMQLLTYRVPDVLIVFALLLFIPGRLIIEASLRPESPECWLSF